MRYYRLYFLDAIGHIEDVRECTVDEDTDAIAEAERLDHHNVIEIWCQGKKITEIPPRSLRQLSH